jgi:hypothetical protein
MEEKRIRRAFTREFKAEIVRLVLDGGLGIPDTRVRRRGPITTSRPGRRSGTKRHNFGADRHTPGTTDR